MKKQISSQVLLYTNSLITAKSFSLENVKYRWRRVYQDKIKMIDINKSQYYCSPLDWKSLIELEVQHNGTLIHKETYGPIQKQLCIQFNQQPNTYNVKVQITNNYNNQGTIQFNLNQEQMFKLYIQQHYLSFSKHLLNHRGWDFIYPQPQSNSLKMDARLFWKQWQIFLDILNQKPPQQTSIKFIFDSGVLRDLFIFQIINYSEERNLHPRRKILHTDDTDHQSNDRYIDQGDHIPNIDTDLNNTTIQDIANVLYTPNASRVSKNNNPIELFTSKPTFKLHSNYQYLGLKDNHPHKYKPNTNTFKKIVSFNNIQKQKAIISNNQINKYVNNPMLIQQLITKNRQLVNQNQFLKKNGHLQINEIKIIIKMMQQRIANLQKMQKQQQIKKKKNSFWKQKIYTPQKFVQSYKNKQFVENKDKNKCKPLFGHFQKNNLYQKGSISAYRYQEPQKASKKETSQPINYNTIKTLALRKVNSIQLIDQK